MKERNGIRRTFTLIAISLFLSPQINAQEAVTEVIPYGSRSAALGLSYTALSDFWSTLNNPANIAYAKNGYESSLYFENSYLIKELNLSSIGASNANKILNFGVYLSRYGISSYNHGNAALIVGKEVWRGISVGAKIAYHYFQVSDGYGSVGAFSADVGVTAALSKNARLAVHIINPTQEQIGKEVRDPLPSGLVFGGSYTTNWGIEVFADIEKKVSRSLSVHSGTEWALFNCFFARVGYKSNPDLLCAGIGYLNNFMQCDFSVTKHSYLGYSPQISATFWINKNKIVNTIHE